ncbi:MAG: PorT family protein [Candidatus Latescibacterota bacterium]|nr:MAG: PorT family protein [Candidatus Latescibacterota bacterium]
MTSRFVVAVAAIAVVCMFSTDVMAVKTWETGIKAGVQTTKLRGDQIGLFVSVPPTIDVAGPVGDSKIGFVGGGFIRRNINDMFSLQGEVLYSQKGGKGNVTGTVEYQAENNEIYPADVDGELTVSLDYVEVPVLAVFSFEADERFSLVAELGLSFAFSARSEIKFEGQAVIDQPNFSATIRDFSRTAKIGGHIQDFDLGGVVGGGVEVLVGDYMLYFDARLVFGFTSIDQDGEKDVHNQAVSIFAGFGIPFGSEM